MLPDGRVVVSQGTSVVKVEVVVIGAGVVTDRVHGQATKDGQPRTTKARGDAPESRAPQGTFSRLVKQRLRVQSEKEIGKK